MNIKIQKWYIKRTLKRIPKRILIIIKYFIDIIRSNKIIMKNIEEIRDKHKGETIFIAGSGPSLDTYPDDFLKDKISMTLHLAYTKFSNPTYAHITEADRIQWLRINRPEFFNIQGLFCNPFFPLVHPDTILKKYDKQPYFLSYNPRRLQLKNVEKQILSALEGKPIKYSSNGTCLHTGIWSSLILGFKRINIIGCEHKKTQGNDYSSSAIVVDKRERSQGFFEDAYYRMRITTDEIIRTCKKYNIIINKFVSYEDFLKSKQTSI